MFKKNWKRKETVKDLIAKADDSKWYSTANDRSDELEDLTILMLGNNQNAIERFRMIQMSTF